MNPSMRFSAHGREIYNGRSPSNTLHFWRIAAATVLFFMLISGSVLAQHPLVGTWEMVSIKGINAEGKPFSFDTSGAREVKIITPTHYMLIAQSVQGDTLVFNRTYAGTILLEGNKYIETPTISSLPIFDNVKSDFTWKIEGDRFIQSGTFTRPDGKKIILDALVFQRVKTANTYPNNAAIGTWSQLSSSYTTFDGAKHTHTNKTTTRYHIITPTHWMRISHRDGKFEHAIGGTYTLKDGKVYPSIDYASSNNLHLEGKIEMAEKVDANRMHVNGSITAPDGKQFLWEDLFERTTK